MKFETTVCFELNVKLLSVFRSNAQCVTVRVEELYVTQLSVLSLNVEIQSYEKEIAVPCAYPKVNYVLI